MKIYKILLLLSAALVTAGLSRLFYEDPSDCSFAALSLYSLLYILLGVIVPLLDHKYTRVGDKIIVIITVLFVFSVVAVVLEMAVGFDAVLYYNNNFFVRLLHMMCLFLIGEQIYNLNKKRNKETVH